MLVLRAIFLFVIFMTGNSAVASPITPFALVGKTAIGEPCYLVVEEWFYEPADQESWANLRLLVSTNWQFLDNPPVALTPSPTPWALYGKNKQTRDQFAVDFTINQLDPSGIKNFLFQTYSEVDGTIQHYCRFN